MTELDERYGDKDIVVNEFVKKALNWSNIRNDSPKDLDTFSIFLSECEYAVQDLDSLKVLEYSENFRRIISKLPYSLQEKWRSIVLDKKEHSKKPVFHDLVKFVRREARKATDPAFGKDAMKNLHQLDRHDNVNKQRPKSTFATKVTEIEKHPEAKPIVTTQQSTTYIDKPGAYAIPCNYCKGSHALETCWSFSALPFLDRTAYLKTKGFCFGCLRYGHHRRLCKNKATCRNCAGRHPSVLHVDGPIPTSNNDVSSDNNTPTTNVASAFVNLPVSFNSAQNISDGVTECSMAIIPVKVRVQGSNSPTHFSTQAAMHLSVLNI